VERSKYVSSFIGFAPAENPRLLIAVVMDEPKTGARDGGGVSAPIFREIAQRVLGDLNVVPDMTPLADPPPGEQDIPEAVVNVEEINVTGPPTEEYAVPVARPAASTRKKTSEKPGGKKDDTSPVAAKTAVVAVPPKTSKTVSTIWKTKPRT
jgi:hypothetical protein